MLALLSGGGAVTQERPDNTAEPRISGAATVGSTLSATQGSWANSPTSFAYQWVRRPRSGGQPNGSDCAVIGGATTSSYVVATADADRRLRVRVTAANADGSATAASNATALIANPDSGRPNNIQPPTISGTPLRGKRSTSSPARGTVGSRSRSPSTGLRHGRQQLHPAARLQRRRVRRPRGRRRQDGPRSGERPQQPGESTWLTAQTAVVTGPQGPAGVITLPNGEKSIPVTSVPPNESLVVDQTVFGTNPVRSRTELFQVRDQGEGLARLAVRDALVFFRSTPP